MRLILAMLVASAALAAATAGSSATPAVTVTVAPSTPTVSSRDRGPSGRKTFSVAFRVNVAADQECENLSVAYSYRSLFDGRPSLSGSATDFFDTNKPASSASFDVHARADPADVVSFSARGMCEDADGNTVSRSAPVQTKVSVPAHSCDEGPARVAAARRTARQDLRTPGMRVRVRGGHYLWTGYRVWVGRRGRVTYGAAECHGLRATVSGPASFVPGDYSRRGYGAPLELGGGTADFRGDQHSGGVETNNAVALPHGKRAGPSKVSRFQVVSYATTRGGITRVRVQLGQVYVAGRSSSKRLVYGTPVVARAGQTVVVGCDRRGCRPKRV